MFSHAEDGTQHFEVFLTRVLEVLGMLKGGGGTQRVYGLLKGGMEIYTLS